MASDSPDTPTRLETHYTFGDVDLAADRLQRLAQVFEPALLDFLTRVDAARAARVLDLGCGPGHTTRTLAAALAPRRLIGVDGSERFLARARRDSPPDIEYRHGDVTTLTFDDVDADLVYSRFLLTHLPDPAATLSHWAGALRPRGRILLQECAHLGSGHTALARYYELVGELQRRHGQSLHIGRELPALVDATIYRVVDSVETPLNVPASAMAELHAMNIQTWRHDAAAQDFDAVEIDRLHDALRALAADEHSGARVEYTMREMVLERVSA